MEEKDSLILNEIFHRKEKEFTSKKQWKQFIEVSDRLYDTMTGDAFDPRFNTVHWASDIVKLLNEIAFSFCWMLSYAKLYKGNNPRNSKPAHVSFQVSFFADNCITRIHSCRDKIALMIWAYYTPFNPEEKHEILNYYEILKRLKYPLKYGIRIKGQNQFVKNLDMLNGEIFNQITLYRHLKIHRREPRIEIYGPKDFHDIDYMFPLLDEKEIKQWEAKLEKEYSDPVFRQIIKEGCIVNGVIYDQRRVKDRLWDFDKVRENIESCLTNLFESAIGCVRTLLRKNPLRNLTNN